jgi:hypothetical protein
MQVVLAGYYRPVGLKLSEKLSIEVFIQRAMRIQLHHILASRYSRSFIGRSALADGFAMMDYSDAGIDGQGSVGPLG